jgi:hypothetical protein
MDIFSRRRFLQGSAGALGAIGLSKLALSQRANHYGRALAQSTPRKVALLVGINDYSRNRLGGAVNDVELQKQLLIHRFGFNPADVHILREEQASRQDILGAFNEYLYEPAQAGDVVVFHFSGHGDRVRTSDRIPEFARQPGRECLGIGGEGADCLNTAIAPYDYDAEGTEIVQNIMGHTLLLMRAGLAQKTDNVTFILDCCYAGGGKRGNAIMRSLNQSGNNPSANPSLATNTPQIFDTEWAYQQEWLSQLGWSENDFAEAIMSPTGQGFFVGSAKSYQFAADYSFDGFVAGAFTYLLTQYLWQSSSSLAETITTVTSSSTRLNEHSQTPEYDPQPQATRAVEQKPIYHIPPISRPAEALVLGPKEGESDRLWLWLGGLDPQRLDAFDQGATFSIIDKQTGDSLGEIQQVDGTRRELVTEGKFVSNSRGLSTADLTGQLLQERTRGIPDVVVLKIALDDTLTQAEKQFAMDELGRSTNFEVFPVQPGKAASVLLGRYTEAIDALLMDGQVAPQARQPIGSIGLFSPVQVPMLTGSFGAPDETVEAAIQRLKTRLSSLHIGRMLALMVNGQASQLDVSVEVAHANSRTGAATRGGGEETIIIPQQSERGIEQVPVGSEILVTVNNNESVDLHFGILAIDSAGEVNVIFPTATDNLNLDVIKSNDKTEQPLKAVKPYGLTELLVIASPQSLVGPLATLQRNAPKLDRSSSRGVERGEEVSSVEVMEDLFSTMDVRRGENPTNRIEGTRLLDVEDVAVLSLLFEIMA